MTLRRQAAGVTLLFLLAGFAQENFKKKKVVSQVIMQNFIFPEGKAIKQSRASEVHLLSALSHSPKPATGTVMHILGTM